LTSAKATSWKSPAATSTRSKAGLAGSKPPGPGVFTRTSSPPALPAAKDQSPESVPQCAMSANPSPFTSATAIPVLDSGEFGTGTRGVPSKSNVPAG
jgi:hypothetical protein